MTPAEKFAAQLNTDTRSHVELVKVRALIGEMERRAYATSDSALLRAAAEHLRRWGVLAQRYHDRQTDYRTNTAYKVSQWLTDASDRATQAVRDWWQRITGGTGLGLVPLAAPVVLVAGAVLSIAVVSYFVSRYYSQTTLDYDSLIKQAAEIAKTDPALAQQILATAAAIQEEQSTSSLGTAAEGIKWGVAAAAVLIGYKAAVNYKLIPDFVAGKRRR